MSNQWVHSNILLSIMSESTKVNIQGTEFVITQVQKDMMKFF